jgi:hypothetical protein
MGGKRPRSCRGPALGVTLRGIGANFASLVSPSTLSPNVADANLVEIAATTLTMVNIA